MSDGGPGDEKTNGRTSASVERGRPKKERALCSKKGHRTKKSICDATEFIFICQLCSNISMHLFAKLSLGDGAESTVHRSLGSDGEASLGRIVLQDRRSAPKEDQSLSMALDIRLK